MSMKHPVVVALLVLLMTAPSPMLAQDLVARDTLDVLRPGDVVRLAVWREDAFSGDFTVDRSGRVVLPRLGAVEVTGVPTPELREQILEGLGRYLRNPSMDVTFLRRVAIHGAVMRAGLYPVDPTMTVLDALALAGGARHDGRLDRIRLIREGEDVMTVPTTGMQMEELRIRSGDQLMVPEQTWFRRNNMLIATGISAAASLAIALLYISRG
jgi:protein involved in polysaccharide export with SLBB domain